MKFSWLCKQHLLYFGLWDFFIDFQGFNPGVIYPEKRSVGDIGWQILF